MSTPEPSPERTKRQPSTPRQVQDTQEERLLPFVELPFLLREGQFDQEYPDGARQLGLPLR